MDSGQMGWLALWGAVAAAGVSVGTGAAALGRRRRAVLPGGAGVSSASNAAGAVAASLAGAAVAALTWSLLSGNFALAYVADTTTRQGSWAYRLAGLWGGNGGSLLLWAALVLAVGVAGTRRRPQARLIAVAAGGALLLVDAVAANPFARLQVPAVGGGGLTPILRYPAMLYHPLLVYGGHAVLAVSFALALGGEPAAKWLAPARRYMLAGWLLLGVALVAGAHWAYVELGWGGFWAWDPVENSGLIPWLAATAFLHHARRRPAEETTRGGLVALASLPFLLSLVGAAVSRSGAAPSVHGFANAGPVGLGLTVVLVAAAGAVATVLAHTARRRGRRRPPQADAEAGAGSDWWPLGTATVALLVVAGLVLVATAYPVVVHALSGSSLDVSARYYAGVVLPVAVLGLVAMGLGPTGASRATVVGAGAAGVAAGVLLGWHGTLVPALLGGAATWVVVLAGAELSRYRSLRRTGALLAHGGFALLLLGAAWSLTGTRQTEVVAPGGSMRAGGYTLTYREAVADDGPGWQRVRVLVDVASGGRRVATLEPALRVFPDQAGALSDVALRSRPTGDLTVTVERMDPTTNQAVLTVATRPGMLLVWWGGLAGAAGGLVVLLSERRRRRPADDVEEVTPAAVPGGPASTPATVR